MSVGYCKAALKHLKNKEYSKANEKFIYSISYKKLTIFTKIGLIQFIGSKIALFMAIKG